MWSAGDEVAVAPGPEDVASATAVADVSWPLRPGKEPSEDPLEDEDGEGVADTAVEAPCELPLPTVLLLEGEEAEADDDTDAFLAKPMLLVLASYFGSDSEILTNSALVDIEDGVDILDKEIAQQP